MHRRLIFRALTFRMFRPIPRSFFQLRLHKLSLGLSRYNHRQITRLLSFPNTRRVRGGVQGSIFYYRSTRTLRVSLIRRVCYRLIGFFY